MKRLFISSILMICFSSTTSLANNPTNLSVVDTLTLKIVNDTPYTLSYMSSEHSQTTLQFNLLSHIILSKSTAYFFGSAIVGPDKVYGLGGTIKFSIDGEIQQFVIGDSAIGWDLNPTIGFGSNSNIHAQITRSASKNNPRSYDLSWKTATVKLTVK